MSSPASKPALMYSTPSTLPSPAPVPAVSRLAGGEVTSTDLGFRLGPRINAGGRIGQADMGARLLATQSPGEAATLAERKSLAKGSKAIADVAARRGLNAKYLGLLWSRLNDDDRSLLLDDLRARWRTAKPQDAAKLASNVIAWQRGLWTFSSIGLLGRKGSRSRWLEKVSPLLAEQELRLKIPAVKPDPKDKSKPKPAKDQPAKDQPAKDQPAKVVVISLVATAAGDGNQHDDVVWQKPRLVVKGKPDLLLRDVLKSADSEQASHFGKHPDGTAIDASSLCVRAPSRFTVRLPLKIAGGRELVTTAVLHPKTGGEGSVQVDLVVGTPKLTPGLRPSEVKVTLSRVNIGADEQFALDFLAISPNNKIPAVVDHDAADGGPDVPHRSRRHVLVARVLDEPHVEAAGSVLVLLKCARRARR